jgi:hypothetical protein
MRTAFQFPGHPRGVAPKLEGRIAEDLRTGSLGCALLSDRILPSIRGKASHAILEGRRKEHEVNDESYDSAKKVKKKKNTVGHSFG